MSTRDMEWLREDWQDLLALTEDWMDSRDYQEDMKMECKQCGRPVEQAIEGELICSHCWSAGQQDDESKACDAAIAEHWAEAQRCQRLGICFTCEEPLRNVPNSQKHVCYYQSDSQEN